MYFFGQVGEMMEAIQSRKVTRVKRMMEVDGIIDGKIAGAFTPPPNL